LNSLLLFEAGLFLHQIGRFFTLAQMGLFQTGTFSRYPYCEIMLISFCRETGLIPRSASRCQMIARVERALRRAFHKRAQERPLHLERFATIIACVSLASSRFKDVFLRVKWGSFDMFTLLCTATLTRHVSRLTFS